MKPPDTQVRADTVTPIMPDAELAALRDIIAARSIVRDSASGILAPDGTRQNWIIDLQKTLLDPRALEIVAEQFWNRFAAKMPFQLGGVALGAVPLIIGLQQFGLRLGYRVNGFVVRPEREAYGLVKAYEGQLNDDPVVIVDDTVNSGRAVERARIVLAEEGRSIRDVFAVIDYCNPSTELWLSRHSVQLQALLTLPDLGLRQSGPRSRRRPTEFAPVWHFSSSGGHFIDVAPGSTPAIDGERLYVGSDGGNFWALDQRTGTPCWSFSVGGSGPKRIRSSPAISGDRVYFCSYEGNVHCLAAKAGAELWRFAGADRIESSPCLAPEFNMLFVGLAHTLPGRRGSVAALNAQTGAKIWEFSVEGLVLASPSFDPELRVVACGTHNGELLAFDPVGRRLLWRYTAAGAITAAPTFDAMRMSVLVGTHDGHVNSIDLASGTARWSFVAGDAIYSTPLLIGDRIYVGSTDKHLYTLDAVSGAVRRTIPLRGRIYASPCMLAGRIYLGTTAGIVYEIDPVDDIVTGEIQLPERITDSIVHSPTTDLFYARSHDGQIYAFRRSELATDWRSGPRFRTVSAHPPAP